MSIPSTIRSADIRFRPGLRTFFLALLGALFLVLPFVSCHSSDAGDIYILAFKLDTAKVGVFDSVRIEIFNGKPPGPGDTTKPVQVKVIETPKGVTEVKLELSGKVTKDFSVMVTGFDSTGAIIYRKEHSYENFAAEDKIPAVLLLSRIDAAALTLSVGETRSPTLVLAPADAGDKRVFYTSASPAIVQVVKDSLKGLAAGTAKVTVATADAGVSTTFLVTVVAVRVTGMQSQNLSLKVGDTLSPIVSILPANATDKTYSLTSLDSTVAAVAGKTLTSLNALKAGSTKVIIASTDGGAVDTISVSVRLPVKGLTAANLSKEVGDGFVPDLTWDPADATDKKFTMVSKDSLKVKVTANGDSLLGMAAGLDTVIVTSHDGAFSASFTVTVAPKVFKVKGVTAKALRGVQTDTLSPDLTWDPVFATDKGFSLKSLDTSVAVVIGTRLNLRTLGTVKVELTTADGGLLDTFDIVVENANFQSDILPITSFKCAPCHAPLTTFNWQDSLQLIRKGVSAIDRLTRPEGATGHMPLAGSANGQLSPRDLAVMLNWLTRVAVPLKSVTVADTVVNLGDTVTPAIVFTPANASNKVYALSTGDSTVASIRDGNFLAAEVGNTTVFVTMDENSLKTQMKVTVNPPSFQKNVLPIVKVKCFPCHTPGTTFNWQDSVALLGDGSTALKRLALPFDSVGHMPLKGSDRGELTAGELKIMLAWLHSKVVPVKGFTVPDDSVQLGQSKLPAITWDPVNATNKTYVLTSLDTAKLGIDEGAFVGKALGSSQLEIRSGDGLMSRFITVKIVPVKVDSIVARDSAGAVGDTVVPGVGFFPANATTQTFSISLLAASTKVKIDPGNKIIGLDTGKVTIVATSTDGAKTSQFKYTVGPVLPKSITVADTNGTSSGSDFVTPHLVWNPASTTNKAYTLSIPPADTNIAAVRGLTILGKALGVVSIVTAKSVADTTVKATFKFTVGPVPVIGLTVAATSSVLSTNITPVITWNPANATNKGYTLTVNAGHTANLSVSGGTLNTLHLDDAATVTVTSTDGAKTATWSVKVVRTPYKGAVANLFFNRCNQCHNAGTGASQPNWQDSATVVSGTFPSLIKTRIAILKDGNASNDGSLMPPTYATLPGPLPDADIKTLTDWLNQN